MKLEMKHRAVEKKYRIGRDSSGEIFCIVTVPECGGRLLETYHVPKVRLAGREDFGTTDDGAQNLAASILADILDVPAANVEREFFGAPRLNRARAVCVLRSDFVRDYIEPLRLVPDAATTITGFELLLWLSLPQHSAVLNEFGGVERTRVDVSKRTGEAVSPSRQNV